MANSVFEAPQQAAALTGPMLESVPGWVYFLLLVTPYIIGIALTLMVITVWKKMHMAETGKYYSVTRQFRVAMLMGFAFGAWATYAFQELGEFLINIPPLTVKSAVTMGFLVAFSNPFIYDYIRERGKITKKPWLKSLARVLTVRPKTSDATNGQPLDYDADDTTQTLFKEAGDDT